MVNDATYTHPLSSLSLSLSLSYHYDEEQC